MNYLEQLVSEWYKYQGYFVKENIRIEHKEIDVLAFNPHKNKLIHIEVSTDYPFKGSNTEEKYKEKFEIEHKHIKKIFEGYSLPARTERKAVFLSVKKDETRRKIGGGTIIRIEELLTEIHEGLHDKKITNGIVHENLPIIRTMQIVFEKYHEITNTDKGKKTK